MSDARTMGMSANEALDRLNGGMGAGAGPRTVFKLTVPERIQRETGDPTRTVSVRLLSVGEEKAISDAAQGVQSEGVLQQVFTALCAVNGTPVSKHDGSAERAYASMHPRVRTLLSNAISRLHGVERADVDDFLRSQEVTSG